MRRRSTVWFVLVVLFSGGLGACLPAAPPETEPPSGDETPPPDPGDGSGGGAGGGGDGAGGGGGGGGGGGDRDGGWDPSPPVPPGDTTFWSVVDRQCTWCHTRAHPAADIDLEKRSFTQVELDAMGEGVQLELAPFVEKLPARDKQLILDWVRERGGHVPEVTIPATFSWNLDEAIAELPDGAPAPGFAFVVEDRWIDTESWTVTTWTDRHGRTYRGIALDQRHRVDPAVFSSSRNPSSYLAFNGIPWHGRFYNSRMEGDVRVGRWMSVGMHTEQLSPTGRDHRKYVRLQFDRDSICLRSAPTRLETWPWGDEPDGRLEGRTNAAGFYQTSSEWLHFVFESRRTPEGVRWTATVTNPATGEVLADLSALERDPEPLQGTFFLHAYSTGDQRHWANLSFTAEIDPTP